MYNLKKLTKVSLMAMLMSSVVLTSCSSDDDVPPEENELEVITDVKLIFTAEDGSTVTALAEDPDGEGVEELTIDEEINLVGGQTYTLTFEILNALDEDDVEDIGDEILEEGAEHQIFFGFTNNAFSNPTGTGNIDGSSDINYDDEDVNGNPIGLETEQTTSTSGLEQSGDFTVRLQHQPDVKTSTSGVSDGDTDFELTFVLNISEAASEEESVAITKN